ncbi:MAG: dephospho-CoA kinase [Candidatus Symbiothrix sp.]|jgi:dephospho-CoA kinase|nr:dephospho-CoA kinase [Candidatus Symbiothrix sp.]
MITIGITGGIGSGKSVISQLFEINGIPVYNSDTEAKRLTTTSPAIRTKLTERFGADLYRGGQLDKSKLAALIFQLPVTGGRSPAVIPAKAENSVRRQPIPNLQADSNLAVVNAVIHPEVARDFSAWKQQNEQENSGKGIVALESAILFESGFDKLTDVTLAVEAPLQLKIDRVKQRDNLTEQSVLERINNQMTDAERKRLADYIIVNDDQQALIPQVENLLRKIGK